MEKLLVDIKTCGVIPGIDALRILRVKYDDGTPDISVVLVIGVQTDSY